MDLKQIESFVRVAELGSFTRAAIALGVQQPLLSRHVRQLEVELRQNLLDRNGRGVTLTEAGRALLLQASPLWTSAHAEIEVRLTPSNPDDLRAALRALDDVPAGPTLR